MNKQHRTHSVLNNKTILVTRPAEQAHTLIDLLTLLGATVIENPAIEIVPANALPTMARYQAFDVIIFISRNAVQYGISSNLIAPWPSTIRIAAIGQATTQALESLGFTVHIKTAKPYNSEALLSHPDLSHVADLKIAIVRGQGGRELLADALKAGGAKVTYIECYSRRKPLHPTASCQQRMQAGPIDLGLFTSMEGLLNTVAMLDDQCRRHLLASPIVVATGEMSDQAKRLGFTASIICSESPMDRDMLKASQDFYLNS